MPTKRATTTGANGYVVVSGAGMRRFNTSE